MINLPESFSVPREEKLPFEKYVSFIYFVKAKLVFFFIQLTSQQPLSFVSLPILSIWDQKVKKIYTFYTQVTSFSTMSFT